MKFSMYALVIGALLLALFLTGLIALPIAWLASAVLGGLLPTWSYWNFYGATWLLIIICNMLRDKR